jgi:hypothetical protein
LREGQELQISENKILNKAFVPKKHEVKKEFRVNLLHSEKLRDLYMSPSIVRIMKSERLRRAGHGGDKKCIQNIRGEASWQILTW